MAATVCLMTSNRYMIDGLMFERGVSQSGIPDDLAKRLKATGAFKVEWQSGTPKKAQTRVSKRVGKPTGGDNKGDEANTGDLQPPDSDAASDAVSDDSSPVIERENADTGSSDDDGVTV